MIKWKTPTDCVCRDRLWQTWTDCVCSDSATNSAFCILLLQFPPIIHYGFGEPIGVITSGLLTHPPKVFPLPPQQGFNSNINEEMPPVPLNQQHALPVHTAPIGGQVWQGPIHWPSPLFVNGTTHSTAGRSMQQHNAVGLWRASETRFDMLLFSFGQQQFSPSSYFGSQQALAPPSALLHFAASVICAERAFT